MSGEGVQFFDVIIVGMGPVGALAANLCGKAGLKTLVLERGEAPYTLPRAIHFDAEAMRIFQSVGLADEIAAVTRPMGGSVYLGCDHRQIRNFRSRDTRGQLGWPASNLFYQPKLEAILRAGLARYPNVTVELRQEVLGVSQSGERASVEHQGPGGGIRRSEAQFVLACDGASSSIRKALGLTLDDMMFEERWLVLDAFVNGPMRWPESYDIPEEVRDGRCSLMVCDPERPATLIPGAGAHRRWEYMLLPGEQDAEMLEERRIRDLISLWVSPADVEIVRAAVYRFHGLVAHRWREGSVFLLGDAAHQTPPFFGQGMCHGVRDAAQLVWKLKLVLDGKADQALLDTYQVERERHVRTITSASVEAGAAVCILDPELARERDRRFRAEEESRAGATVAMTDVVPGIAGGVIADGSEGSRSPQPPVLYRGEPARLDDLIGDRFTLLSLDADPLRAVGADQRDVWRALGGQVLHIAAAELADPTGQLAGWLSDLGARSVVVRPDRYLFGAAASDDALPGLLAQLFEKLHLAAAVAVDVPAPAAVEITPS